MAQATTSTLGEIVLSGDFAGTAELPTLVNCGVVSGAYETTARIVVDSKGRTISIGALTQAESDALVDAAYASTPSAFTIVLGRPVLTIPDASVSVLGLVTLGANIVISSGVIDMADATVGALGCIKTGVGVTTSGPDLIYDYPALLTLGGGTMNGSYQFANLGNTVISSTIATNYTGETVNAAQAMRLTGNPITTAPQYAAACANGTRIVKIYRDSTNKWYSSTSTDGTVWTTKRITLPGASQTTSLVSGITTNGTIFVAVGTRDASTGKPWSGTSSDGLNWTFNAAPWADGHAYQSGIAYGASKFVIVGRSSTGYLSWVTSSDGITWSESLNATSVYTAPFHINFNGTSFVCLVNNGSANAGRAVWSSTNGTTWVNRSSAFPSVSTFAECGVVTNGSGTFLVVNGSATSGQSPTAHSIWYSTDHGVTWTNGTNISGNPLIKSLFWVGTRFLGTTASTNVTIVSTAGTGSWTQLAASLPAIAGIISTEPASASAANLGVFSFGGNWYCTSDMSIASNKGGNSLTRTPGAKSTNNGTSWTRNTFIPIEIPINFGSHDGSGGGFTSAVGSIRTVSFFNGGLNSEITFSNTTAIGKTPNGDRIFSDRETYNTLKAVYISQTEWLITKD